MSSISPSTRTRTKPCRRAPSMIRSPSVLRSLMSGPRTSSRVPSGRASTWSTICWTRLALDGVAVGAVRDADPREQQPQVVVDLGDRADRRARVARRALLVDRDRRGEPVDLVDVGLLHLPEELPGVGAQALDVAPLALGVDGVEGEAALARAAEPGDDDEPVARERDVDVLEVVFARAAHDELILGHGTSVAERRHIEQAFVSAAGRAAGRVRTGSPVRPGTGGGCPVRRRVAARRAIGLWLSPQSGAPGGCPCRPPNTVREPVEGGVVLAASRPRPYPSTCPLRRDRS